MSGCCGGKRAALSRSVAARPATAPATPPPARREEPRSSVDVPVEYSGHTAVLVRGPDSGRLYAFSAGRRVRNLPRGDAQALLRTPLFRSGAR